MDQKSTCSSAIKRFYYSHIFCVYFKIILRPLRIVGDLEEMVDSKSLIGFYEFYFEIITSMHLRKNKLLRNKLITSNAIRS